MKFKFYRSISVVGVFFVVLLLAACQCQDGLKVKGAAYVKVDQSNHNVSLERSVNATNVVVTGGKFIVTFNANVDVENGYYIATPEPIYSMEDESLSIQVKKLTNNSVEVTMVRLSAFVSSSFYLVVLNE